MDGKGLWGFIGVVVAVVIAMAVFPYAQKAYADLKTKARF